MADIHIGKINQLETGRGKARLVYFNGVTLSAGA